MEQTPSRADKAAESEKDENKVMINYTFKYVEIEGNWRCTDEDCQMPVPNGRMGKTAIALIKGDEILHYKCIFCRGTLKEETKGD